MSKRFTREPIIEPSLNEEVKPEEVEIVSESDTNEPINTIEETVQPQEEEKPVVKSSVIEVQYREVVYLGVAKQAERIGAVTGNVYIFKKDMYGMPSATQVDERDYAGLVSEKGKGCARRSPEILFMSKLEWNLELEQARIANNS